MSPLFRNTSPPKPLAPVARRHRGEAPGVKIDQLAKTFASVSGQMIEALAPISITIGDGEFLSVVGPSGCGKTTLLRMVAGLERPSSGTASINGEIVTGPRRDVGTVFQRPELLEWRTIRSNILLPAEVQHRPLRRAEDLADELLEAAGLVPFKDSYPHELSGGMQQRAAIARALVIEPLTLLLDEPFGALDALTRERMNLYLAQVCDRERIATLLITHSFDEAVLLSDRIIVLSERPGTVIGEIIVDLPRPRTGRTLALPGFSETVQRVRSYFSEPQPDSSTPRPTDRPPAERPQTERPKTEHPKTESRAVMSLRRQGSPS